VKKLANEEAKPTDWWGDFDVQRDQTLFWHVGPLKLWIQHRVAELRLGSESGDDPLETASIIAQPASEILESAELIRFAGGAITGAVRIEPALADRSIVVRPEIPFKLLPGLSVSVYITTPLWVRVFTREPNRKLLDIPSIRPSDTWFGPSSILGELCYASMTSARLQLAEVPVHPGRAVTTVRLDNRTKEPLYLDRLNAPVPHLALFRDEDGDFWTQSISGVWQRSHEDSAKVVLEPGPPKEAKGAKRVAEPRKKGSANLALRAIKSLLG
jgi:hypothetical protein